MPIRDARLLDLRSLPDSVGESADFTVLRRRARGGCLEWIRNQMRQA